MLNMDCPLLDKSAPAEMSPAISSPEMKRWKAQATQRMKCHGKLDKKPKRRETDPGREVEATEGR